MSVITHRKAGRPHRWDGESQNKNQTYKHEIKGIIDGLLRKVNSVQQGFILGECEKLLLICIFTVPCRNNRSRTALENESQTQAKNEV